MASAFQTFRNNFSPLRLPNFRLYLGGQAVSLIGTWLQMGAQSWVVWELSHSEEVLGITTMLATLPLLLFSPWAGVWADRLNRRHLLIFTQVGAMMLAFAFAALEQFKLIQIWHIYILSFLLGCMTTLDFPAQQAFLGDLAGTAEVRRAVNLNAMVVHVSRMIGPALAGFVIGQLGAATAFWVNGLSFIAVILSLVFVQAQQVQRPGGHDSVLRSLAAGFSFLGQSPRVQDLFILAGIITFFGLSVLGLMPAIASEVLQGGPDTMGLLLSASGAGALIGTTFFAPIAQAQKRIGVVLLAALFWMGCCLVGFSFTRWLPLAWLMIFLFSLGAPLALATSLGLLQVLVPPEMRARLLSLMTMISFGLQPIAAVVVGFTAERLGNPTTVLINGIAMLSGSLLLLLLRPALRQWELADHK